MANKVDTSKLNVNGSHYRTEKKKKIGHCLTNTRPTPALKKYGQKNQRWPKAQLTYVSSEQPFHLCHKITLKNQD